MKETVKQVIDPDSLKKLDAREVNVPYDGAGRPVQRTGDVIKSLVAMITDVRQFSPEGILHHRCKTVLAAGDYKCSGNVTVNGSPGREQ